MPKNICPELHHLLTELKQLKSDFDSAAKMLENERHKIVRDVYDNYKNRRDMVTEKIKDVRDFVVFEIILKLEKQYVDQIEIFKNLGITEKLSDGQEGIVGVDEKEYPIPKYEEVLEYLKQNADLVARKAHQNFKVLLLVPFAKDINGIAEVYFKQILSHFVEHPTDPIIPLTGSETLERKRPDPEKTRLFATKKNPEDGEEQLVPLELNIDMPLDVSDDYRFAASSSGFYGSDNDIVYFPETFVSYNQEGLKKTELLRGKIPTAYQKNPDNRTFIPLNHGWQIILIEDLLNIPGKGMEKNIGGRTQINTYGDQIKEFMEPNQEIPSINEYLKAIQNPIKPEYQDEIPMTPEADLIYSIIHLEQTNQVINDCQGNGSANYNIAACRLSNGGVPISYWIRALRNAALVMHDPTDSARNAGVRTAVRFTKKDN